MQILFRCSGCQNWRQTHPRISTDRTRLRSAHLCHLEETWRAERLHWHILTRTVVKDITRICDNRIDERPTLQCRPTEWSQGLNCRRIAACEFQINWRNIQLADWQAWHHHQSHNERLPLFWNIFTGSCAIAKLGPEINAKISCKKGRLYWKVLDYRTADKADDLWKLEGENGLCRVYKNEWINKMNEQKCYKIIVIAFYVVIWIYFVSVWMICEFWEFLDCM